MKTLFWGVLLIIVLGIGGLVYRNAIEHPSQPIACPMDAQICPDGTSVSRTGSSCTFPECPLPNVSLPNVNIAFAIPSGFTIAPLTDEASIAQYDMPIASSTPTLPVGAPTGNVGAEVNSIVIRSFAITASSTALSTIQETAIGGASGAPVGVSSFSSVTLGGRRFTVVPIERFEGVIDTAYYLARNTDVLRFDAIDRGADWTNPDLDISTLPAHLALIKMLTTLQGQ